MKRRNRWLSMLLTVTMLTAQLPVSPVIAAEDDSYETVIEEVEEDAADEEAAEELTVPDAAEEITVDEEAVGEAIPVNMAAESDDVYADEADIYEEDIYDLEDEAYVANRVTGVAADEEEAEAVAAAYNAKVEYFENGIVFIDLEGSGYTVASAMNAYINSNGTLPVIEPDYIAESGLYEEEMAAEEAQYLGDQLKVESDWNSMYSNLTNPDPWLNPASSRYQWYHDMIGTYDAWGLSTGSPDIITCVIADGTKTTHEDLSGTTCIGYIKGQKESFEKGTALAGIIGAKRNNGKGGAGIAPDSKVYTFDVNDRSGVVTAANLANAILSVANLQLTIKGNEYTFKKLADRPKAQIILIDAQLHASTAKLRNVIQYAHDKMNITFVAPAGDYDSSVQCFPAVYEQVIGVAAVDSNGEKTARSSFGEWVDVAAPGYQIYAPSGRGGVSENKSEYRFVSGTSAAAAVVAGACALFMSTEGWVKPSLMKEVMKDSLLDVEAVSENGVKVSPGKGIVCIPEMMGVSELGSRIKVYDDTNTELKVVLPTDSKATADCPSTGYVKLDTMKKTLDKNGKEKYETEMKNLNAFYLYTLDGSEPSVVYQDGKYYAGDKTFIAKSSVLKIEDILDKAVNGNQTINLKVKVFTGRGKLGKTTSIKIYTIYKSNDVISVNIINQPKTLMAGKSVSLKAEVYYIDQNGNYVLHPNQKVSWYISEGSHLAKIADKNKGVLKANKGANGEVKIECIAEVTQKLPGAGRKSFSVNISSTAVPVKTITLNMKKTELDFDSGVSSPVSANDINRLPKPEVRNAAASAYSVISVNSVVNKDGSEVKDATAFEWKSSKPAVASIEIMPGGRSVRVTPLKKGTTQISCKALDGSGKTVKCKVTVKHLVTDITIKGQTSIFRGKKATYKAVCIGGFNAAGKKIKPNNKKVTWSLLDMGGNPLKINGVTINEATGKLKVETYASIQGNTDIYVAATTKDRGHYTELYKVTLMGPGVSKASAVSVRFDSETVFIPNYYVPTYKKNSREDLSAIKLHSLEATKGTTVAGEVILQGFVSNGSTPIWTSSNSSIVSINTLSQNKVKLCGLKAGNATLTCDAGDGSGKKTKIKVNVLIPASNVTLIDKKLDVYDNGEDVGYSYLAKGGSTQLKASLGAVYGTPSVKKVTWEMEIVGFKRNRDKDGTYSIKAIDLDSRIQPDLKNQFYKLDTNTGTVSVVAESTFNSRLTKYADYYKPLGAEGLAARVYATTTDGTYTVAGRLIVAIDPLKDFRIYNTNSDQALESYTLLLSNGASAGMPINYRMGEDRELTSFTARSTDTQVLNGYVEITRSGNEQKAILYFVVASEFANDKTKKEATVDLIVTPNDGSNKQVKLKVTVKK